jgi:hypothetical protein
MGLEILERERKKGFLLVGLYREREREISEV